MFKFSFQWLKNYCGGKSEFKEILKTLNLQGFEFQGEEKVGEDTVTAIEVKANRPDMLSHMGIAREIKAYKGEKLPFVPKSDIKICNEKFPVNINIKDTNACTRFCGILLKNVNNNVETPEYIKSGLQSLGINLVNPVVDITNYVMVDMGQPMHSYDVQKLKSPEIYVDKCKNNKTDINTLGGNEVRLRESDIVVSDDKNVLCVAGIIGTPLASVTSNSSEILLEAAVFDEVSIRLTSRALKISTPSSFRFERGINAQDTMNVLNHCAKMIAEICHAEIYPYGYDFCSKKTTPAVLNVSAKNIGDLLGISLSPKEITNCLEKYNFICKAVSGDILEVTVPSYRLDVKKEVDIAEEVARIYGYDNIPAVMPTIKTTYSENKVWTRMDTIRNALVGMNFSETINYSFIPSDTMDILNIRKEDPLYSNICLQNPISGAYALMRPTLVYSLVNCLAYNYSLRNCNLALFEFGRTYHKDESYDTGCKESDTCGFIMAGSRIPKGWGCEKEISFNYYDLISYLKVLMDCFGESFELNPLDYDFCEKGSAYEIILNKKRIGFMGELDKTKLLKIKNVKLIKDKVFYCEFCVSDLTEKVKKLGFESKYPPVKRLYNLICDKNILSQEIINIIKNESEIIRNIDVKDIYEGKNMPKNLHAVLYEITYRSNEDTLTCEEIEATEKSFLDKLKNKLDVCIKDF